MADDVRLKTVGATAQSGGSHFSQGLSSGLISGGLGMIGSVFQNIMSAKSSKDQRNWIEEMWRKNNEYNSPSAQMSRLRAAGLNPNLIYGSSSGSAAGSSSTPSNYEQPKYTNPFEGFAAAGLQMANMMIQRDLLNAKAANLRADTRNKDIANTFLEDSYNDRLNIIKTNLKDAGIKVENDEALATVNKWIAEPKMKKAVQDWYKFRNSSLSAAAAKSLADVAFTKARKSFFDETKDIQREKLEESLKRLQNLNEKDSLSAFLNGNAADMLSGLPKWAKGFICILAVMMSYNSGSGISIGF